MNERDWTEDLQHRDGDYLCRCCDCQEIFHGHKRRVVCKVCASQERATDSSGQAECDLNELVSDSEFLMRLANCKNANGESFWERLGNELVADCLRAIATRLERDQLVDYAQKRTPDVPK